MPYIPEVRRMELRNGSTPDIAGELNYELTLLAIRYIGKHGLAYRTINDVLGAFEGAKQEFYRRVAAPYEDTKIKENGDVYTGS